jgi:uncharacterized short protein YbdD (DUF466 family)
MLTLRKQLLTRIEAGAKIVRRVIGAPDYEAYVKHVRACHPDAIPLTRDRFVKERMEAKYSRPGSRCC